MIIIGVVALIYHSEQALSDFHDLRPVKLVKICPEF